MYTKKFTKNQYEKTKKTVYLVKKGNIKKCTKNHKNHQEIMGNI